MIAKRKQPRRKNAAGFYAGGQFHPIRSGVELRRTKTGKTVKREAKTPYDAGRAGDFDFPAERAERKAANRKKAEKTWQQQEENRIEREMFGGDNEKLVSLVQFVRKSGGIKPSYTKSGKNYDAGELSGLTFKQSKKRGLVSEKSRYTLDGMYQNAREAGYDVRNEDDLLDKLDDEIRKGKKTFQTHGYLDYRDNPTKKTMQSKPRKSNGVFSRWNNRRKAGNQLKRHLRHTAAAKRAAAKQSEYSQKALENPSRRTRRIAQPSLNFKPQGHIPAIGLSSNDLKRREYANLVFVGMDGGDRYYTDSLTGYRFFVRQDNPAAIRKIKNFYYVVLADRTYLKDAAGKAFKTRSKRQAQEVAAKTKTDSRDELNWLKTVRVNPTGTQAAARTAVEKHLRKKAGDFLAYNGLHRLAENVREGKSVETNLRLALPFLNKSLQPKVKAMLNNLKGRKNPAWLPSFANLMVGTASALQIKDHIDRKTKTKPVKRAARKNPVVKNPLTYGQKILADKKRRTQAQSVWNSYLSDLRYPAFYQKTYRQKAALTKSALNAAKKLGLSDIEAQIKINDAQGDMARKLPRQNPAAVEIPTRKAFEMFRGRPADSFRDMPVSHLAPKDLDALGDLVEITFASGEVRNFEEIKNGKPFYKFALCMNKNATRLWIAGGKFGGGAAHLADDQIELIDDIVDIVYAADKPHIEGDSIVRHYVHALGEITGDKPTLGLDKYGFPIIHGGAYEIEWRGIVN